MAPKISVPKKPVGNGSLLKRPAASMETTAEANPDSEERTLPKVTKDESGNAVLPPADPAKAAALQKSIAENPNMRPLDKKRPVPCRHDR